MDIVGRGREWEMFFASLHVELLPKSAEELVRSTSNPRQELVVGYWQEVLNMSVAELDDMSTRGIAAVKAAGVGLRCWRT